jgi:ferredoxin
MAKVAWVNMVKCISCGLCISYVPSAFRLDDEGKAECYNPDGASEEKIQKYAIRMCPVPCIHWQV